MTTYWHMQMHPDDKSFADAHIYSILESKKIIGLGEWNEVIGFHAGNVHHLARGGREGGAAKRRMRVMLVAFYIKVAFTAAAGCTHNLITPLLVAESVSRHPPRFAAGRSDTAGSGARAGR